MPYQLEKAGGLGFSSTDNNRLYDKKGMPKINRYYEKLKPYYKL